LIFENFFIFKEREFAFSLEFPASQKVYFFSGESKNETEGWMKEIAEAGGLKNKVNNN